MLREAVIFDFNGVLLWDTPLHEAAWRVYSEQLRGHPLSAAEMTHHVHGRVNRDIFDYVLGRPVTDDELPRLAEEKETIYRDFCLSAVDAFRLSPGAMPLLDWLRDTGVPRTIATSSAWPNVAFYIDHLDLGRWFDLDRLVYDRGDYPGKPAPDIYLEAARVIDCPPARCIVVEDSVSGIASAVAAGAGHVIALGPAERHVALCAKPGVAEAIVDLHGFPRQLLARKPVG